MRAVVHTKYGSPDVLRVEEVDSPVPADDEVLVKVRATTVNRTDCGMREAKPFIMRFFTGLTRPKRLVLGFELAGEVEAVGAAVTEFAVGDTVFGANAGRFGANAELVCVRQKAPLAKMPAGMTFEEAAAVCDGALAALSCLRNGKLRAGERILVYGASGSIGTAAVQLAKHLGAHVTAVCNTKNVELVRSLGADEVIDYEHEDFTKNGETYDVIFDAVGMRAVWPCWRSLVRRGRFIGTDLGFMAHVPLMGLITALTSRLGSRRVVLGIARYAKKDVLLLKQLIEAGEYRAVIDRCYPLEQVREATEYVETRQKTGNVVLQVSA